MIPKNPVIAADAEIPFNSLSFVFKNTPNAAPACENTADACKPVKVSYPRFA